MIMMFLESMRQAFWIHSDKFTNFRICHRSYIISANLKTLQSRHYVMVTAISALVMARTVQLLNRHDPCVLLNCPRAEIRAVDSQSDLRILL